MAPTDIFFGAPGPEAAKQRSLDEKRLNCERQGGRWDGERCIIGTPAAKKAPELDPKQEELIQEFKAGGRPTDIPTGQPLTREQSERLENASEFEASKLGGISAQQGILIKEQQAQQAAAGQDLAAGVGQFGELGISPTGLDVGEAATTGIVSSIPKALGYAVTGAGIGFAGGSVAGPVSAGGGAAIGAVTGFVTGISSGMISNFKSQRTDTTTSQQRVLDEGKQTMNDWVTLAANDPANRARYLTEYNKVAAQIDQAYRQMKLDTSRDVAKFETALPNLAEFEAFYAAGGERDFLNQDMRTSLINPQPSEYAFLELANRRA